MFAECWTFSQSLCWEISSSADTTNMFAESGGSINDDCDPIMVPSVNPSALPVPTVNPTNNKPSLLPTVTNATANPVASPSAAPTRKPTGNPSAKPTAKPANPPTVQPSILPTAADTVSVDVALTITATAAPTESDEETIKSSAADESNVDVANIHNFVISYSEASRRWLLEQLQQRRRLATTYTWSVTFEIVVSLANLDDDSVASADAFASKVADSMSDSLSDALQSAGLPITGVDVDVSAADDDSSNHGHPPNKSSVDYAFVGVGAALFVVLLVVGSFFVWRKKRALDGVGVDIRPQKVRGAAFGVFEADTEYPIIGRETLDVRTRNASSVAAHDEL